MTEEKPKQTEEKKEEKPQPKPPQSTQQVKEKIEAKPLPIDKEKAKEIEQGITQPKSPEQSKTESTPQPKERASNDNKKAAGKKEEKPKSKKYEAIAHSNRKISGGNPLPISTKTGKYICAFIKGKEIDKAIEELNQVILFKKPVPYKGEIPHRKGKGIMSGRFPIKACKYFINMLKALKGNAIVNGLELEKTKIHVASANKAARPMKTKSREAKRTYVILKAKEFSGGKK